MMTIDMRQQLITTQPNLGDYRMFKLLIRCRREIDILSKKADEPTQVASCATLLQRLKQLEQRQKFYENQLGLIISN